MLIQIQEDYWVGDKCVENEVPWFTPDSIHYLDTLCKSTDTVLEIGTGGSTLFFARRCKTVLAIETNPEWYAKMKTIFEEKNITNVIYLLISDQNLIEEKLAALSGFDIASVDSVYGFNRSRFLNIILEKQSLLSTLVLDNYGADCLFNQHFDYSIEKLIAECPPGVWKGQDFNDSHWIGNGTRILTQR